MTSPTEPTAGSALDQEIVIEGAPAGAQTGAQAIAPDHSPRAASSTATANAALAVALPARSPRPSAGGDVVREIEQFLYRQSELLDLKQWQAYIDLFATDGVYWMPVAPDQTEWEGSPSIFAEDRHMMEVRMRRVTHPTAWSQAPMWSTSHVIGNVVLEAEPAAEQLAEPAAEPAAEQWIVRSRFHMMELRRDTVRHFGGTYRHTLVRERGELRIKLQRVDMFNAQAPYDYVLQVWV
ncbi:MAG TPA: aromatic-ring-hydroxylating dioxygenase subunit beta [Kofleriaceae bacterium]|jgi:3-phenylpropionate/cinnamic acid dioxygenase small subunit|nr:aromatic-ring-hydroxylating dioxygenase subunit beta [Kofleriaceae bacterium]